MVNYKDMYCGECNYCIEVFGKNRGKLWCELHKKRAEENDVACRDFVIYEEDETDELDD